MYDARYQKNIHKCFVLGLCRGACALLQHWQRPSAVVSEMRQYYALNEVLHEILFNFR